MDGDRYFAFLRAINTGNRRLTNEQLLAPFVEFGFTDVAAYQAAGNVTFRCDDSAVPAHDTIEEALAVAYGFEAPTFVRSAAQLRTIVDAQPFSAEAVAATAGKIQVAFLRTAPSPDIVDRLADVVPDEDLVRVIGNEWYWLPVEGISASRLPMSEVGSLLGEMTMRTLGTIERMATKFAD